MNLNVSDVVDENGKIKERLLLKEQKTSKRKSFPLNNNVREALAEYLSTIKPSQTSLFASRKGNEAITRQCAHTILSNAADAVGIKEAISCHSLRKSFSLALYENGVDLTRIQALLNHSSPKETLRYIGITQAENDEIYLQLNL